MLVSLGEETDQSLSEVFRRALCLYFLLHAGAKKGGTIVVRDTEGEREIVLLEFTG